MWLLNCKLTDQNDCGIAIIEFYWFYVNVDLVCTRPSIETWCNSLPTFLACNTVIIDLRIPCLVVDLFNVKIEPEWLNYLVASFVSACFTSTVILSIQLTCMHIETQCTYIFLMSSIIFIHSLQDADIGEEGGVALSEALRGMANLQHLK